LIIDDEDKARHLARALMSDITLYNSDKIAHALDPERELAESLEEGRQLFQARVAPRFYMVFEDAVHKWAARRRVRKSRRPSRTVISWPRIRSDVDARLPARPSARAT